VIRMNTAQKTILVGAIIGMLLVPFVPYLLEPNRWSTEVLLEEASEILGVAFILFWVFRSKTGEMPNSEVQRLTKKRRLIGGGILALVAPVFGPGHGFTVLFQFSRFAYDAAIGDLAYFGLPYVLGALVVYYLVSALVLFLALSAIVWMTSDVAQNRSSSTI
jgi:hypothetical protein